MELRLAAVERQAAGDVKQPGAQSFRLGLGELTFEQQPLGPDDQAGPGSASFYSVGRMPYHLGLGEALRRELGLDGSQRLLDVGCGPGSLTLLVAPHVATAVGIDADREMIEEATRATRHSGHANVSWRHMRAEALPGDLGEFDLVTFAQSFHWMDRPAVAPAVREMLAPGGACVYVHATTHRGDESVDPLAHPRPPYEEIGALVFDYLGPVRRAGRGSLPEGPPADDEVTLREAGFEGPHQVEVPAGAVVTHSRRERRGIVLAVELDAGAVRVSPCNL